MTSNGNFSLNASTAGEINHFLASSKEVDGWFLMDNPWPVCAITAFYLLFSIKLGPDIMKDREPFNLKPILLTYNFYQTIFNSYIVSMLFTSHGGLEYVFTHACHPMDPAKNIYYYELNRGAWYFFISKVVDLLDTVFFILRKKQSQVTFLHVYHHANMVLSTWAYLKYVKGEQGLIVGVVNSAVHVIMYSYYFLSALSPKMQKYLWWKKYITRLQMFQFLIFIFYMIALLVKKCDVPYLLTLWIIFEAVTFLILFAHFYVKTYLRKSSEKKKVPEVKPQETVATIKTDNFNAQVV